jgi:hypothetical protein
MRPQPRPNADRSPESLEARLRALPPPPVPRHLEARLLAAIPAKASNEMLRLAYGSRFRPLAVWARAVVAVAAACLLSVVLWPGPRSKMTAPNLVANPEKRQPALQDTPEQPGHSFSIASCLEAARDLDGAEQPLFTWPIHEKSPLMVSTATRPDLLD